MSKSCHLLLRKYEEKCRKTISYRYPFVIRIDGIGTAKQKVNTFDKDYMYALNLTAKKISMLLKSKNSYVFAYIQGDEINLIIDPKSEESVSEFLKEKHRDTQKIVSSIAGDVALSFNDVYKKKKLLFDVRVFNLPTKQLQTYLIWRQKVSIIYGIQFFAKKYVPYHKRKGIDRNGLLDLIKDQKITWTNLNKVQKYGLIIKDNEVFSVEEFKYLGKDKTLENIYNEIDKQPFHFGNF